MRRRTYSDEQLLRAVRESESVRQVLGKLGLVEAGGNYSGIKKRIAELGIDSSHFLGPGWRRGSVVPVRAAQPLSALLVEGSQVQTHKLKKRLIAASLKKEQCDCCGGVQWLGGPIPLELDHINGNTNDNRIDNLRLLCPNCHALTPTYRGKKLTKCRDETAPS